MTDEEAERIMAEEKRKKEQTEKVEPKASENDNEEKNDKKEENSNKQKPLAGNGGIGPNYVWSQTLDELTMTIPLPENTTAKQLDVIMQSKKFKVGVKG